MTTTFSISTIASNAKTAAHAATLARFGFSSRAGTRDGKPVLEILSRGFVKEMKISSTNPEEAFRALAAQGMLCTYSTKFFFVDASGSLDPTVHKKKDGTPSSTPFFGVPACVRLGAMSAFVVSPLGTFDPATGKVTVSK